MNDDHTFDDTLISGYIDGELTQGSEQGVRVHLETCDRCRTTAEELRTIKEAAMATRFEVPEDLQWDETPRSSSSRLVQRAGWIIAGVWLAVTVAYALWQAARDTENVWEAVITFGGLLGLGLVFVAVLSDQLKSRSTDKYRSVQK